MTYIVGGLEMERPFRIRRIGHYGHHCENIQSTVHFMANQLGLIPSDWYDATGRCPELSREDATGWFFRCGTDHHALVVASQILTDTLEPQRKGEPVNQLAWQIGSVQEVVDAVAYLDKNARLRRIGRDAPGSNYHAYAYDPDGYVNEVFYGIEQIGWQGESKPRNMHVLGLKDLPVLPCSPEYAEVNDFRRRGEAVNGFHWQDDRPCDYVVEGLSMPQPFKLTRLGRVTLFVSDLQRSLDFYTRVLGLTVSCMSVVYGHECAFLRAADEHHTLALYPEALKTRLGFVTAYGMPVATYQQLQNAHAYFVAQGVKILDLPVEMTPGVHYGFWVQGPDRVAVHIYYGMDRVATDGRLPDTLPRPPADWPASIVHGGSAWFDPPFDGPWA